MAKRLGFGPDSLIRPRPDPKQRWKLPVKQWIHELHFKRFRHLIGAQDMPRSAGPHRKKPSAEDPSFDQGITDDDNPF